jgi:two-component system capsular synthesis response regulator RcsB
VAPNAAISEPAASRVAASLGGTTVIPTARSPRHVAEVAIRDGQLGRRGHALALATAAQIPPIRTIQSRDFAMTLSIYRGPMVAGKGPRNPIRIALLDDHEFILKGLTSHLRQVASINVVGSHGCSRSLRAMLAETPVDVVLLDYALASDDMDGVALVKTLRARYPNLRILVVSGFCQSVTVNMLLREGANGFFAKNQDAADMVDAIVKVMGGETYLPPFMSAAAAKPLSPLSPREWEVIRCFLDGMSVSQIAAKFNRSLKTISTQKSTAYKKLGIRGDAELFKMRDQVLQAQDVA